MDGYIITACEAYFPQGQTNIKPLILAGNRLYKAEITYAPPPSVTLKPHLVWLILVPKQ